jgi:hypothetical protein
LPSQANGYLILDQYANPNVVKWKVNITKLKEDSTSLTGFRFDHVETFNLIGTNYVKMNPTYYTDGDYFIQVQGNNASDIGIVEEGPVQACTDCPTSHISCKWACIGKDYAYALDLWVAPNDASSYLDMVTTVPSSGPYEYYYQWVDGDDWISFKNSNQFQYYSLSNWVIADNANKLIQLENVPPGTFTDANGFTCLDQTVYGVRKHYGPWRNAYGALQSNTLMYGQTNCGQNFNWARNQVNANTAQFTQYNVPQLSCNGTELTPTGVSYWGSNSFIADDFVPCMEWIEYAFEGDNGNLWVVISQSGDCITEGTPPNNSGAFVWPEELIAVTIKSNDGMTPIVLKEDMLFDQEGNFIADPIALSRGFYSVGFQFADHSYKTVFFERTTRISSNLTQADFLNVNIYEVPVEDDDFHLQLEATATLKFTYSLYDAQANLLFEEGYVMEKDSNINELIEVGNGIPSGVLINKFRFSDGSEKTIQTIK